MLIMTISDARLSQALGVLGERLRRARLDVNLSQKALAERTGVALKTIANAEDHGRISVETLLRLLHGLGRYHEFEQLLTESETSPIDMLERDGRKRRRASRSTRDSDDWQW